MVRNLVYKTAWQMDQRPPHGREPTRCQHVRTTARTGSCARRRTSAIQTHGGIGYTRHKPFEHIYRHHRRYRITEGSEEIQIRRVAGHLFGYTGRA